MRIDPDMEPSVVGGKAYNLARLNRICSVPPFFVLQFEDPAEIEHSEVQATIVQRCRDHHFGYVAVRSSGNCEDSQHDSFAGIFETRLNVPARAVPEAVAAVLRSAGSPRALEYVAAKGLAPESIQLSVIVQRQLAARVSGVCFTKLPGEDHLLLIEACFGLGELIVSGMVIPDGYFLDRQTNAILRRTVGYQDRMLVPDGLNSGTRSEGVPFHRRGAQKLTDREIQQLGIEAIRVEAALGFESADLEWAFESDRLFMLQARPITGATARSSSNVTPQVFSADPRLHYD
jgi:pyruvate,water dikinase